MYLQPMKRQLLIRYLSATLVLTLLMLQGCRSLDDDSEFEIKTYSSFFLVKKNNGDQSLYQYRQADHRLDSAWNVKVGVPDAELSDALMKDNFVWIANATQHLVLQANPSSGIVNESFSHLSIAPHHFSIGEHQVLISDTVANKVAFLKRRNGHLQEIEFEGKPGKSIYNSGKFYLQVDDSLVAIYDETALTVRATIHIGLLIDELLLDRYHTIIVMAHDSSTTFKALITANADYLVGDVFPVLFSKYRPTPYFTAQFGSEYLHDLELLNGNILNEIGFVRADSVLDFEADFFEGTLFYTHGNDFVAKSIVDQTPFDSLSFHGHFLSAFHQYSAQ